VSVLYLIRHGATESNESKPPRLQGRGIDGPLSAEGRRQAAAMAQWLASRGIDAVYSSPLCRARQTAEELARRCKLLAPGVRIVEELIEADVGAWEGLSWEEVEGRDPEAYRLFTTDASIHPYLGGENFTQVLARTLPAMDRIMAENAGRRVAVVAHNVVNRAYLAHWMNIPLRLYRSIPQDNCGVNVLRFTDGKAKIVTINAVWY